MFRCFRSVFVVAIALGTIATMPVHALADTSRFKLPAFDATPGAKSALRFHLDHALMPHVTVDARIGSHAHATFDVDAQNSGAGYEITSVTMHAIVEYRFNDRAGVRIDVGPHPAFIPNERLAVELILRG